MKVVVLMPLEPIATRYTSEWLHEIPRALCAQFESMGKVCDHIVLHYADPTAYRWIRPSILTPDYLILDIRGPQITGTPTPGAFLDFVATNAWKSGQMLLLAQIFDQLRDGDSIWFADAWNPAVINTRYMVELSGKDITLVGQWHAGCHDPHDQLRYRTEKREKGVEWALQTERAMYEALDFNLFATHFYFNLFHHGALNLDISETSTVCGLPMDYLTRMLPRTPVSEKELLVVFPHRVSSEKRISLFRALVPKLEAQGVRAVVAMEVCKDKAEYHDLLRLAACAVSFARQETFGISMVEALCCNALPLTAEVLSYTELFHDDARLPCLWEELIEQADEGDEESLNELAGWIALYARRNLAGEYEDALRHVYHELVTNYLCRSIQVLAEITE